MKFCRLCEFTSYSLSVVVLECLQSKRKNDRKNPEQGCNDKQDKFQPQVHSMTIS